MARPTTKKSKSKTSKSLKTLEKVAATPSSDASVTESATTSATGTGKRFTPEQRQAIAMAEGTLKDIAERFDTSINTVARYRKSGSADRTATTGRRSQAPVDGKSAKGGLQVSNERDFIVVRIPKSGLIKQMLGSMFN